MKSDELDPVEAIYDDLMRLVPNAIFVFGSNTQNIHGSGSAKAALRWGAVYGDPIINGIQGRTYALCTKLTPSANLDFSEVTKAVRKFLQTATEMPEKIFLVTRVGCKRAGFSAEEIAPLFQDTPPNVILPAEFTWIISGLL